MKLVRMHSNFNSIIFSIVLCYKNCTIKRKDSFSISTYDAWIQQQFLYGRQKCTECDTFHAYL